MVDSNLREMLCKECPCGLRKHIDIGSDLVAGIDGAYRKDEGYEESKNLFHLKIS